MTSRTSQRTAADDRSITAAAAACLLVLAAALGTGVLAARQAWSAEAVDRHAADYMRLATALDRLDPDFLDRPFAIDGDDAAPRLPAAVIAREARRLRAHLRRVHAAAPPPRVETLARLLDATAARAERAQGRGRPLREEVAGLGAVLPHRPVSIAPALARELDALLPGGGALADRLAAYEARFVVPRSRLHAVLTAAIDACRARTRAHLTLPADESVTVEYAIDVPWSGYSSYQGGFRSRLRVNRGVAFPLHRLVTLACHETYPGHHTSDVIRDVELVRRRGWREAVTTPLFTPDGFAAEALATAASALAFSRDERLVLYRDRLFPLAGLAPGEAARYVRIAEIGDAVTAVTAPILVAYLDGTLTAADAAAALRREAFMADPRPALAFADHYGAYSLAYTEGAVRAATAIGAGARRPEDRWHRLARLIVAPVPLR